MDRKTKLIIGALILAFVILLGLSLLYSPNKPGSQTSGPTKPLPDPHPPAEVTALAIKYTQVRENSVGANQPSTASWIAEVKTLSTPAWFAKLQPKPGERIPPGEYNLAHSNNYIVRAKAGQCTWSFKDAIPTSSAGVISCTLEDETINGSSKQTLAASSLPFGWTHVGEQAPATYAVVKQAGAWLIDNDLSSPVPD